VRRVIDFFWGPADPRTYALVRIALSVAGLANLLLLWPVRQEYFASTGMVSIDGLRRSVLGSLYPSLFFVVSSEKGVTLVFLGAAAALVALGLGYWIRTSALIVLVWHVSYSDRAFPILHSWDALLRIYSLLVLVSPTGRVWSLERRIAPRPTDQERVPVYGIRLMQWQAFVLYVTTVWLKVPDEFWRNGQLSAYFSVSFFSRSPNSLFLVRHEWLSAAQTYASLSIEASVPWLLYFKKTRFLGMLAGFALHFMIAVTSTLGIFSLCKVPAYLAFLDGDDIDTVASVARRILAHRYGRQG
jgi:hypothetical protein